MSDKWTYPVIWIQANGELRVFDSHDKMHRGDKKYIKSELLIGSQFIDPSFGHWRVTGAEYEGNRPLFSEWPRYLFSGGSIRLETNFLGKRTIGEVASLLCTSVDRDVGLKPADREDFKARICSAEEFGTLVASLKDALT